MGELFLVLEFLWVGLLPTELYWALQLVSICPPLIYNDFTK